MDRALWHTTFESGEVRETIINGTPLCAIHQIRLKLVKSYSNCQFLLEDSTRLLFRDDFFAV